MPNLGSLCLLHLLWQLFFEPIVIIAEMFDMLVELILVVEDKANAICRAFLLKSCHTVIEMKIVSHVIAEASRESYRTLCRNSLKSRMKHRHQVLSAASVGNRLVQSAPRLRHTTTSKNPGSSEYC